MMRIDVVFDGKEYTFRTNNSGSYLFIGVAENRQISCESGFNSLPRFKRFIREYLRDKYHQKHGLMIGHSYHCVKYPRIKFMPDSSSWKGTI